MSVRLDQIMKEYTQVLKDDTSNKDEIKELEQCRWEAQDIARQLMGLVARIEPLEDSTNLEIKKQARALNAQVNHGVSIMTPLK